MSDHEQGGQGGQGEGQELPGQAPEIPVGDGDGDGGHGQAVVDGGEGVAPLQVIVQELVDMLNSSGEAAADEEEGDAMVGDEPMPEVQQLLNHVAAPDLLPFPGVDARCFDLWFTVRRRLMGLVYEGDQLLWRRSRYGLVDEEVVACVYGNYGLVMRLMQALPTIARSFHVNMDAIASMDRLITAQQDILEDLLDREPVVGEYGNSSEDFEE